MMAGIAEPTLGSYFHKHTALLMLPGLLVGVTLYILLRNIRSPFVLPIALGVILSVFYGLMWIMDASFEDARAFGWVAPLTPLGRCCMH